MNSQIISCINSEGKEVPVRTDDSGSIKVDISSINKTVGIMTRAATTTAYTAGDVIGTDTSSTITFSNVGKAGSKVIIGDVNLRIDTNAIPSGMSGFRLHLFTQAPTAIADNLAFNVIAADRDKYLGYVPIGLPSKLGDTLFSQEIDVNMRVVLVTDTLYGVLETVGAFTPTASIVKTITLK